MPVKDIKSTIISEQDRTFEAWPNPCLLETGNIPIEQIAELALREGQGSNPLYRVHRWFARRVGSQFRSILTALTLGTEQGEDFWKTYLGDLSVQGAVVVDPFMGGGTCLVESARCRARVIGFDIDPIATFITRFELEAPKLQKDYDEIDEICKNIAAQILPYHRTNVDGKEYDVLHHFWVQTKFCNHCCEEVELHPHYQLAYSREKKLQWVFCKQCHAVYELPIDQAEFDCLCGTKTIINSGPYKNGTLLCPKCHKEQKVAIDNTQSLESPNWKLFAQEYIVGTGRSCTRHFKRADENDLMRYLSAKNKFASLGSTIVPAREIPIEGRSDGRPMIHGIHHYSELFNDRQKLHLSLLGQAITKVSNTEAKRCLEVAFSEHLTVNCMYTAYAFGYRRTSPLFSIHSYRHITRPVEINPWQNGIGRGTFYNTIRKIKRAVAYSKAPMELQPDGVKIVGSNNKRNSYSSIIGTVEEVLKGTATAAVKTQSSENLSILPAESVDLILTDPPYFDNLSYSELSDFYLAWHQELGIAPFPYNNKTTPAPILQNLAVAKRTDESIRDYQNRLEQIFSECYRVLKQNGICVFTYHHKLPAAWNALGTALLSSGLNITRVLPMRGEGQGGLHTQEGTIKWDAVLVCRKGIAGQIGIPIIKDESLLSAIKTAKKYKKKLSACEKIGFREPDNINLLRALIVGGSIIGEQSNGTKMSEALNTILSSPKTK